MAIKKDIGAEKPIKMIKVFNFSHSIELPVNSIDARGTYVKWGKKDEFAQELLSLYNRNGSSTHKAIINKKVRLIQGAGWNGDSNFDLDELTERCATDLEIFGGYAIEVIYSRDHTQVTSFKHISFHKIRTAVEADGYFYSNDWANKSKKMNEPQFIPAYNGSKSGRQLFVYKKYNPEAEYYPIPSYSLALNWIRLDNEISKFHLNSVKNQFSPSFLLNFSTGIPTEEEQDQIFRDIQRNYTDTDNANKIIITFSEGKEQAPEITTIDMNSTDERFIMLYDQLKEQIATASEIPLQMVLLVPGKLGSSAERKELLDEFQKSYVGPVQRKIEKQFRDLLMDDSLELLPYNGEGDEIQDAQSGATIEDEHNDNAE